MPPGVRFDLAQVFDTVVPLVAERECLVWRQRRLTFAQVAERSARLASYLHARGLGAHTPRGSLAAHQSGQDHLALALHNGPEYIEAMLGSFKARVVPFNVNYRYVGDELRYLFDDARPRALVVHAALAPTVAEVLPTLAVPPEVVLQVDDDSHNPLLPGAVPYEDALAQGSPLGPPVEPTPDDLYMIYTGGTTGMPKGVLWRQHDVYITALGGRKVSTGEVVTSYEEIAARLASARPNTLLLLPPLMHGAGQWAAYIFMIQGATVVFPDTVTAMDPDDVWRTLERERATIMTVVGDAVLRPLVHQLGQADYDTSSLVAISNGGAALSPAVRELTEARLSHVVLTDSAGSSETGPQMQVVTSAHTRPGTFVPGTGTVVLDEGRTRMLEPGHAGIGWLAQTGDVPLGYLGDAAKTEGTFPVVGGVRCAIPGDRARLLADGTIELLGRDSVTINSGGEKIFVEEVERAIAGHPAVADVVVVGRPSERWGHEVVALVVLTPGAHTTAESVTAYAGRSIARYKLPKMVRFVPSIVRSPAGKADYRWAARQAVA